MVLGFNHNVQYKGVMFHIQTEDSGVATPHIITLLYRDGTIIASKKTSYADILKVDNLEQVVEAVMKDQHKEMLRRLKAGEFDGRAFGPAPPVSDETVAQEKAAPVDPKSADPAVESAPGGAPRHQQNLNEIILDYLVAGENK